ncbi:MAG: Uncharacterised protein [Cryomorphaceae bacterium]|nr:MAG: Uncharacterised protein [Cryomorphaceae bacterium]
MVDHLHDVLLPVEPRGLCTDPVGFQPVQSLGKYMGISSAAQDIYDTADRLLLLRAVDRREGLLRQDGSIDELGWVAAHITVATVFSELFSEIGQ